jgi:oligopeptide/dipeptide ABC transporter ATP-binding protein
MSAPVLKIEGLRVGFQTHAGFYPAIEGIDLELFAGETVGVVGESGCGKSVTALSVLRLLPEPPAHVEKGSIWFKGEDLLQASPERLRQVRGREIAMIFQEPMTSLNPVLRVGRQIEEVLEVHTDLDRDARRKRVVELLGRVRLASPERRARAYPHELSGGMRQRVMIAMALACNPSLLIADEPTTALDVTIQAQMLRLMQELQRELGTALLFITHDLGIVAEIADDVAVMYAGRFVEQGSVFDLFERPLHPYTRGLLSARPRLEGDRSAPLATIRGMVPALTALPLGCRFEPRCPLAEPICREVDPKLVAVARKGEDAEARAHHPVKVACHVAERELRAQGVEVHA